MATTKITDVQGSGGTLLSDDAVDFFIRSKLEEHGKNKYRFREAFRSDSIPAGNGTNIKFVRVPRIVLAGALTEAVPPTATKLETEIVTATATQYGQTVEVSDRAQLVLKHKLVQRGMMELAESAARTDDAMIQNVCLGAANVLYGGGAASRGALGATDYLTTTEMRKALMLLEFTPDEDGEAPRLGDGSYGCMAHSKHIQDLLEDPVFKDMAIRQDAEALRKGQLFKWSDFTLTKNTYGPKFSNLGASAAAVGVTEDTTDTTSGGLPGSGATYYYVITRTSAKDNFEDEISEEISIVVPGATATNRIKLTMPAAAGKYKVYFGDTSGATKLVWADQEPSAVVNLDFPPVAGAAPPAPPAAAAGTVYTSYFYGFESVSVVDLDSLKTYTHTNADKVDPLNQKAVMGTKWYDTAAIVNDAWIIRAEAPSRY